MYLTSLYAQNFRNLKCIQLQPSPHFNLIFGKNGSGKTSLLEAIAYLAYGRSFTQTPYSHLINHEEQEFIISAQVFDEHSNFTDTLGISRQRSRTVSPLISINGRNTSKLSELAARLCVQIIYPTATEIFTQGPDQRRKYLDWGVFYTFEDSRTLWGSYRRALQQRNQLLKTTQDDIHLNIWGDQIVSLSLKITEFRTAYFKALLPYLQHICQKFLPAFDFEFEFYPGWDKTKDLRSLMSLSLEKDRFLGYTYYGCHRADLRVKHQNVPVSEILSRGQLKLLLCALKLTQTKLLFDETGRKCLFLLDDLSSELDPVSRALLLDDLKLLNSQVFVTNISSELASELGQPSDLKLIDIQTIHAS